MFSDPQSLILNASTISVPATGRGVDSSIYEATDSTWGDLKFTVSHQVRTRNRMVARIDVNKLSSDPLVYQGTVAASMSAYFVLDFPLAQYFTDAEIVYYGKGLTTWLAASTNMARLVAGET